MEKIYDTGKHRWQHGKEIAWDSWNHRASRWLYGPCPLCGSVTSSYGGGFSCHNDYCPCSANIFACNAGPMPDWWNTDIDVKLDGDMWCATGAGFIDLQSSPAGFGKSPREAVANLRQDVVTK